MIIPLLLAVGLADPNCWPRHAMHSPAPPPQTYHYHSHWYHPPLQPICRDPWPEDRLAQPGVHPSELPHSPVSPPAGAPDLLGHMPSVIWPGYQPGPPAGGSSPAATADHKPHGAPTPRTQPAAPPPPPVSVPEPATWSLWVLGGAAVLARRALCLRALRVRCRG